MVQKEKLALKEIFLLKFILITLFSFQLYAQAPDYIIIQGVVLDELTGSPLPYAHISLENSSKGTVSNLEGAFSFKINHNEQQNNLLVSSLGYEVFKFQINSNQNEDLKIRLKPTSLVLNEVEVKPINPTDLLLDAISKFPDNHITEASLQTGFYRETVQELDTFRRFSEAVLKIYKAPNLKNNDKVKIEKARKLDLEDSTRQIPNVSGGPHVGVFLDLTKSDRSFMKEKNFKLYNYSLKDIKTFGNYQLYVIEFSPKEPHKKALYKGEIYLEWESLALFGVDFSLTTFGIKTQNQSLNKAAKKILAWQEKRYSVRYREFQGKWHIELATFNGIIDYKPTQDAKKRRLKIAADFLTTDIKTQNISSFSNSEIIKGNAVFRKHLGEYDEDFWENYNFIKGTSEMEKVMQN